MSIYKASIRILDQLQGVVGQLDETSLSMPIATLNNSTIGEHIRHTLEFYTCLMHSCNHGKVNYDLRDHDALIQRDKQLMLSVLNEINSFLTNRQDPGPFILEVSYDAEGNDRIQIPTNLKRELAYNIEHAVHHMALIKIGIREIAPDIDLPEHFGVAVSTVRHQNSLANSR